MDLQYYMAKFQNPTDKQQQKVKMPAAGPTQALRLFFNPLVHLGTRKNSRARELPQLCGSNGTG